MTIIAPVEYLLWAINRDTYVEAIVATNLSQWGWPGKLAVKAINPATGQPDYPPVLIPELGVQLDELGQIPSKADPNVMVEGWHVNMRAYEADLHQALDDYIVTLTIVGADHGIPAAAMDVNGMKYLQASAIATRRRVWI